MGRQAGPPETSPRAGAPAERTGTETHGGVPTEIDTPPGSQHPPPPFPPRQGRCPTGQCQSNREAHPSPATSGHSEEGAVPGTSARAPKGG